LGEIPDEEKVIEQNKGLKMTDSERWKGEDKGKTQTAKNCQPINEKKHKWSLSRGTRGGPSIPAGAVKGGPLHFGILKSVDGSHGRRVV